MIEMLEQHFPAEVAQRVLRYQSHPTADIMRDFIARMEPYGVQELLSSRLRREMVAVKQQAVGKPKRKRKSKFRTFAGAACFDWAPVKPKSLPT